MTPLVTIGIPCFNSARWLPGAIESALAQTAPACEVIVADDGSTDESAAIAGAFGERVTLLRNEHRGANHARREITAAARGDWLQFLDADDFLLPEKIARQLAEADRGAAADVIYSPVWIETSGAGGEGATRAPSDLDTTHDLFSQWLSWQLPQTGGCLWRRSALEKIGGWRSEQPCCQEHELYLRALKSGLRFAFAPSAGAVYRVWSDGTLCRKDPRLLVRVKTELIDDLCTWMEQHGLWRETHRRLAGRACFEMARTLARDDLAEAAAYHRQRRSAGLLISAGPAAPLAYRVAYRVAGFQNAERLARALQPIRRRA